MRAFLSYSKDDYLFADLADMQISKLTENELSFWRDKLDLRAGDDWREGIEKAISECLAVVVVLSANSAQSSYVTYEWAYALGRGKDVIPIKINECNVHPRLNTLQYLDFTKPLMPWADLIKRIRKIQESESEIVKAILEYLYKNAYYMTTFDRLRRRVIQRTDREFHEIVLRNPTIFRLALDKSSGKPGLAAVPSPPVPSAG